MDSSGGGERTAPVTTAEERTADLTEAEMKHHDDFVEEFLYLLENGLSASVDGNADVDYMDSLGGDERNASVTAATEQKADLMEVNAKKNDFDVGCQPELPRMSTLSDASDFPPRSSLPLIDDHDLAPSDGMNRLEDAPWGWTNASARATNGRGKRGGKAFTSSCEQPRYPCSRSISCITI
ncbi:hypothetical protein MHU86_233 [Fragilaria crotonensis]|nr:hypothetical protein MHU86_233 [Fragilaria crotonensis]